MRTFAWKLFCSLILANSIANPSDLRAQTQKPTSSKATEPATSLWKNVNLDENARYQLVVSLVDRFPLPEAHSDVRAQLVSNLNLVGSSKQRSGEIQENALLAAFSTWCTEVGAACDLTERSAADLHAFRAFQDRFNPYIARHGVNGAITSSLSNLEAFSLLGTMISSGTVPKVVRIGAVGSQPLTVQSAPQSKAALIQQYRASVEAYRIRTSKHTRIQHLNTALGALGIGPVVATSTE